MCGPKDGVAGQAMRKILNMTNDVWHYIFRVKNNDDSGYISAKKENEIMQYRTNKSSFQNPLSGLIIVYRNYRAWPPLMN